MSQLQADINFEIREARVEEDYLISLILANAFLNLWNHNWFHSMQQVPPLPATIPANLTKIQESRRRFYQAMIKMTRFAKGSVMVLTIPDKDNSNKTTTKTKIASILLWQPPHIRATLKHVIRGGFLRLALFDYGLGGAYRTEVIYEGNNAAMYKEAGIKEENYHFLSMLGTHRECKGNGYGRTLLEHQIKQSRSTGSGVILDTATESAIKVYQGIGFKLEGERAVDTGTDRHGIKLNKKDAAYMEKKAEAQKICKQRIMLLKF